MTRDESIERMRASTAARIEREVWAEKERLAAEVARKLLPPEPEPWYGTTMAVMGTVTFSKAAQGYVYVLPPGTYSLPLPGKPSP